MFLITTIEFSIYLAQFTRGILVFNALGEFARSGSQRNGKDSHRSVVVDRIMSFKRGAL